MDVHLTGDVYRADYLVDLSNVLRNRELGGSGEADLGRLARTLDALVRHERTQQLLVYAVADKSLLVSRLFPNPADLRTIRRWEDRQLVDTVEDADVRLLELAEAFHLKIVTNDRFAGHRDDFPELQGSTDRVVEVVRAPTGDRLIVRPVHLAPVAAWKISRSQEKDQLKRQGLLVGSRRKPRRDVIDRLWRCPQAGCSLYDGSGRFVFFPRVRDGVATCELHGAALKDGGPRPVAAQMKIMVDGECVSRFALRVGSPVDIGRSPGEGGIDLSPWVGDSVSGHGVSRVHARLELRGEAVYVRDSSTNGTRVAPASGDRRPESMVRLGKGEERRLALGESVFLSRRVEIVRSGRRFPSELDDGRADHTATPPRLAPPTRRMPSPSDSDDPPGAATR